MSAGEKPAPAKDEPERRISHPCPICGRERDARYAPFCSRRCADIDLFRWLKGGYVIPGARRPEEEGEEE